MPKPRQPEFKSIKALVKRLSGVGKPDYISVEDEDVPAWQRGVVWSADEQGLLALSLLQDYPIGLIVLWKKPNGIRVPIDGRQRLTAIKNFFDGLIAIPELQQVPPKYRNVKYRLRDGDDSTKFTLLDNVDQDALEEYEPAIVQYESDTDEMFAMEVFSRLQGGKPLTKTEVRAALGGKVCDFVTGLTLSTGSSADDAVEDDGDVPEMEPPKQSASDTRHRFFRELSSNLRNTRKAHRNVADILLSEWLYPGSDKHWSSLEKMYREKSESLTLKEESAFKSELTKFLTACTSDIGGKKRLIPQLRTAFFILTVFRAWRELTSTYALPTGYAFAKDIISFENSRASHKTVPPWVNFTSALSNAGYAKGRSQERHDILMEFLVRKHPKVVARDGRRIFTVEQKLAIWSRAGGQCEWEDRTGRCELRFADPRLADADHIVRWVDGGPTSIDNGRLLCQAHNRGRPNSPSLKEV